MDLCNDIQEKIARGEALAAHESSHAARCPRCGALAAEYSLLDAALESRAVAVPIGFVDRVMARVVALDPSLPSSWWERRWVEVALTHAAALCTVLNVARFLVRIFVPDIALGGAP